MPAGLTTTPGIIIVTVANPGGVVSPGVAFPITQISITSLSPASGTVGGSAFTLTVNGTGFLPTSTVQWNGSSLLTTYGSATQLTASVPASLIATAGTASVTVVNPGGATSNAVPFPITAMTITKDPNGRLLKVAGFTV